MNILSPENVIALAGFVMVLIGWGIVAMIRSAHDESPQVVMRRRALALVPRSAAASGRADGAPSLVRPSGDAGGLRNLLVGLRDRVVDVGGADGLRLAIAAMACGGVVAAIAAFGLGLSAWVLVPLLPAQAVLVGLAVFHFLRARFRRRFIEGFPGVLDLIVRAVRAGVPISVAIQSAGEELPAPIGPEYKRMSDALRLGVDQSEVLEAANARIGLPEFKFFSVCLEVQRETGGPLTDTLENLSSIIRSRMEVRQKTRALTAEGRTTSKVIAAVPVLITGSLYMVGGEYIDILFNTPAGRQMMVIAAAMVVVGLGVIFRMTWWEV